MPTRPATRCPQCKALHPGTGRCAGCAAQADRARGTAAQRGYAGAHVRRFRPGVLARDSRCVLCRMQPATVADHWPLSRRQLIAAGHDPDDPAHGRGLCASCHALETARHQGGWNIKAAPG